MRDVKANNRAEFRIFDSYHEYVRFAEQDVSDVNRRNGHTSGRKKGDAGWTGTATFDEAIELATTGWSEARAEFEGIASEVKDRIGQVMDLSFEPTFDVTGVCVDVGRMMSGEPECMVMPTLTPVPKTTSMVSIMIETCVSCSVEAKTYIKRGATILALLDVIRQLNIPAEVWLSCDNGNTVHLAPIVEPGQHIDIDSLAFAIAHPSSLRRIGFAAQEAENHDVGWGYGMAQERMHPASIEEINPTIALNGVRTSIGEAGDVINKPVEWIINQLKGAGLEV